MTIHLRGFASVAIASLVISCWDPSRTEGVLAGFIEVAAASTSPCDGCEEFDVPDFAGRSGRYFSDRSDAVQLGAQDIDRAEVAKHASGTYSVMIMLNPHGQSRLASYAKKPGAESLLVTAGKDMPTRVVSDIEWLAFVEDGLIVFSIPDEDTLAFFQERVRVSGSESIPLIDPYEACEVTAGGDQVARSECLRGIAESKEAAVEREFFRDLDERRRRGEISAEEGDRLIEEFEQKRR